MESCTEKIRKSGLDVTRADVVRLLLKHALDATHCRSESAVLDQVDTEANALMGYGGG